MKIIKFILAATVATLLAACGGAIPEGAGAGQSTGTSAQSSTPKLADFAGVYDGTVAGQASNAEDNGTFKITIAADGNITGDTVVKKLPWTLSGTVDINGNVQMVLLLGSAPLHNWRGTIDRSSGAINGTWEHYNGDGVNGTFTGQRQGGGTGSTTTTSTGNSAIQGRYQGAVTNEGLTWCVHRPADEAHANDCGLVYQLGGTFTFDVDANNMLSGDTVLYGNYFPVCPGSTVNSATGYVSFSLCIPGTGGGIVNGEGYFTNGRFQGEIWESCCRFKNGYLNATKQ